MPLPIKPMHELERLEGLFGGSADSAENPSTDAALAISDMQAFFLNGGRGGDAGATQRSAAAGARKYSPRVIALLESIENGEDPVLTATAGYKGVGNEPIYRVPRAVTDNELLQLKAEGLISGAGRAVKITSAGRTALRDRWLREPNQLLTNRAKDKFVHPANPTARRASSGQGSAKFTRTAEYDSVATLPGVAETPNPVTAPGADAENGPPCMMCDTPTGPVGPDGYHECPQCHMKMKADLGTHGRVDDNPMRDTMRHYQNHHASDEGPRSKFTKIAQPYLDDSHLLVDEPSEQEVGNAYDDAMAEGCPQCESSLADHPGGDPNMLICSNPQCAREVDLHQRIRDRRETARENHFWGE